jgi:iron uptake system EfeUOB component EfeO/EfeM
VILLSKPSDQMGAYFQKKGENLEELADHHASIGEVSQAKELYAQARSMYERLGNQDLISRIDEKLGNLK